MANALTEITEQGFKDPDGNEQEVDVIIFATGFDTSWVPRFPIIAHGKNLQDVYAEKPLGYLGVAAPEMPNYLTFYGPYGPTGEYLHDYFNATKPHCWLDGSWFHRELVITEALARFAFGRSDKESTAGQGSVLPMIEFMSRYHIQWIEKMQIERLRSFAPKRKVVDEYGEHSDLWHERTVWSERCRSWVSYPRPLPLYQFSTSIPHW